MSIQVIKRAASGHTNPANRRWPTLLVAQRARRQLVSYDPTAGDRLSELWGRRGAQWERPNKSCDKCVQVGIEAGHVKAPSKRLRAQCEAASSSPMSMPDDWKLLAIEHIFDCRCATPGAPPARAHLYSCRVRRGPTDAATSTGRRRSTWRMGASRRRRCARTSSIWCWGTSSARWATRKARTPCCGTLALADFDNSAVSKQEVDAKLDAWEVQGARIRKEARRLQPEGTAET